MTSAEFLDVVLPFKNRKVVALTLLTDFWKLSNFQQLWNQSSRAHGSSEIAKQEKNEENDQHEANPTASADIRPTYVPASSAEKQEEDYNK